MQRTQVHETFESLLAADPDVMDRDELAGAVAQLRVLRGWCDAVEVRDRPPFESTRRRRPLRVGRRAVDRWWANVIGRMRIRHQSGKRSAVRCLRSKTPSPVAESQPGMLMEPASRDVRT